MKKNVFLAAVVWLFSCSAMFAQGVGINAAGAPPDPSAILDVSSTSQGMVPPRMTTTQRNAIVNPVNGLMIYNTETNCLNIWNGTSWRQSCFDCDFNAPSASNNGPVCEGGTIQLYASSVSGASYSWTGPGGFTSSAQNPSVSNASLSDSGDYVVVATVNGCSASGQTTVVTVNATPATPSASATNSGVACVGENITLSASTIVGATYLWTGPNGFSATSQSTILSNVQTSQTGTYSVVATLDGCSSAAGSASVSITAIPATPGSISGPNSVCPNSTGNVYSIVAVAGATSYNWTIPAGASITSNTGTSITVSYGVSPAGTIAVTAENSCGISSASSQSIIQSAICSPMTLSYTGGAQTFTVPAGVTSLAVKLWGAGGGGSWDGRGGAGAYVGGDLSVTPGETLTLIVGGAGLYSSGTTGAQGGYGGGGNGGNNASGTYVSGSGGGRSAIQKVGGVDFVTAGGGGGGGGYDNAKKPNAGSGGAPNGQDGADAISGFSGNGRGRGATTSSGGAGSNAGGYTNSNAGTALTGSSGGNGHGGGGGGGGGYYGGSGGTGTPSLSQPVGGGGGGSSFTQNLTGVTNTMTNQPNDNSNSGEVDAPNNTDPAYVSGVGVGAATRTNGGNGMIVLTW